MSWTVTWSLTASMSRQMWAQRSANSMFMWMKRPRSMIPKTANRTRVPATNPMRTRHPVLLTAMAVDLVAGAIVGIGRGVGVVNGGSTKALNFLSMPLRCFVWCQFGFWLIFAQKKPRCCHRVATFLYLCVLGIRGIDSPLVIKLKIPV